MLGHEYEPGMGLGQNGKGIASLGEFMENHENFGLGYADKRRIALGRRETGLA